MGEITPKKGTTLTFLAYKPVDSYLINIINYNRGHSNDLCGTGRHDRHQNEEKNGIFTSGT